MNTSSFKWDAQKVKEELPPVLIKIRGRTHTARLTGRLNKFATVTVNNERIQANRPIWYDFQFSWTTIANCLNNNQPLRI